MTVKRVPRKTREVSVHLISQSSPVRCANVVNTYQKGDLFCVMYEDTTVDKFPIVHIFRVREFAVKK